jgi:hypothetical protein
MPRGILNSPQRCYFFWISDTSGSDKRRVIGREPSQGLHDDRRPVFLTASKIAEELSSTYDDGDNELLWNEANTKSPCLSIYETLHLSTRAGKASWVVDSLQSMAPRMVLDTGLSQSWTTREPMDFATEEELTGPTTGPRPKYGCAERKQLLFPVEPPTTSLYHYRP